MGMQITNKDTRYFTHNFVVGSLSNLIKPLISINIGHYMDRKEKVILPFGY